MEANALYEERLQENTAALGEHGAVLEKFEKGMAVGQGHCLRCRPFGIAP